MTKIYQLVNANTYELIGLLEVSNVCESKEVETEVITSLLKEFSSNNNFDDFDSTDDYFFELDNFIIKKTNNHYYSERVYIEDFAPFVVISIPLMLKTFLHSYRVRLKEFRKIYNILAILIVGMLSLNVIFTFVNN